MKGSLGLKPVNLALPVVDQIYQALKSAILSCEIEPGQAISESEIGELLNASRTPVREALSQLRAEGLVVTLPSRGTYVSKLSGHLVRSSQFIREALELATVRHLCQYGLSDAARSEIENALQGQQLAISQADQKAFSQQDDRFHGALAAATQLDRIESLLTREKTGLDRLRVMTDTDIANMTLLYREHCTIYQAVLEADEARVVTEMKQHLRRVLQTLARIYQTHHDYFE